MKYERRIRREGCAIRALEYAFDVSATHDEGQKRLEDLDVLNDVIDRIAPQITTQEEQIKLAQIILIYDGRLWQAMLQDFRQHQSPLGRALRLHSHERRLLGEPRLLQLVSRRNSKIIGHMSLFEGGHTAYLGIAGGRLISVSDNNWSIPQKRRNSAFMTDIFVPR